MSSYSTEDIIRGISRRKGRIIDHVYRCCYPDVRRLILANGGNVHDAEDVFQESLIKIYQKITEHGLTLSCQFKTYLYSVCRFLWLQELEKRRARKREELDFEVAEEKDDNTRADEAIKTHLYESHFRELSRECRKVLNMYFQSASMEEIAVAMGYKNVQIAADKKYRCKKTLMEKIYHNPAFKQWKDEIHLAG